MLIAKSGTYQKGSVISSSPIISVMPSRASTGGVDGRG